MCSWVGCIFIQQKFLAVQCTLFSHTSDDSLILSDVEGSSTETEADLDLHKCSAYEIVNLSQQKVEMETNPAYGEVG